MSGTKSLSVPLVGMHFRPPAKQVLAFCPSGTEVQLRPEDDNPYDEKAVSVWVLVKESVPVRMFAELDEALEGSGFGLEDLMELDEPLQLGFVGDSDGKVCQKLGMAGNREVRAVFDGEASPWKAKLAFGASGQPIIVVA